MKAQIPESYSDLLPGGESTSSLIYRCVTGSQAYGTAGPNSDVDYRGIYVLPRAAYLSLSTPAEQVADAKNDQTYYALRRFIELAAGANPNIIELLFMPSDCVAHRTPYSDRLIAARDCFITKRAYESHVAYAVSQVKRARGQNKWVHNPKPEEPPGKESFCWFIPLRPTDENAMPYRPMALSDSGVNLNECHVAAVEHSVGLYRLYHYGAKSKGVFRGESLVCESIPKNDEDVRCIGLLIFNQPAYATAMKDHRNYWDWRAKRNAQRWTTQERGEVDYDPKNMMHTVRLLLSARHLFQNGVPLVRYAGTELKYLLRVRAGEFTYEELMQRVEDEASALEQLRDASSLPDEPNGQAVSDLLLEITAMWEADHA